MRTLGLFLPIASLSILAACGGSVVDGSTSDGGADAGSAADTGMTTGDACTNSHCTSTPPSSGPDGGPTPVAGDMTVAIHQLYIGDADRNGVASTTAWQDFGLNIDGKVTTAASTDVCTLYAGASRAAQMDGTNGIDNSFGDNILPILLTVAGSGYSTDLNHQIAIGGIGTILFSLGDVAGAADASSLSGAAFDAVSSSTTPMWNGTDIWTVDSSSVMNGSITAPVVAFSDASIANYVWTSGSAANGASLPFLFLFPPASVPIRAARVTMTVSPQATGATDGMLAGVVDTQEFVAALMLVAGNISQSLCSGSAFASIAQQIDQASDIMSDGTNGPGQACDAISIGFGFDATTAQVGAVVTPPTMPNPCSP
jgi:hypothetical protein